MLNPFGRKTLNPMQSTVHVNLPFSHVQNKFEFFEWLKQCFGGDQQSALKEAPPPVLSTTNINSTYPHPSKMTGDNHLPSHLPCDTEENRSNQELHPTLLLPTLPEHSKEPSANGETTADATAYTKLEDNGDVATSTPYSWQHVFVILYFCGK